jgi:hypothetical protein
VRAGNAVCTPRHTPARRDAPEKHARARHLPPPPPRPAHRYKHASNTLGCDMTFTVFFPAEAEAAAAGSSGSKVPVLYYLSGLTCTDENVTQKGGAQAACAKHGIAFVAPDTSPRYATGATAGAVCGVTLSRLTQPFDHMRCVCRQTEAAAPLAAAGTPHNATPHCATPRATLNARAPRRGLNVEGEADSWDFGVGAGFYINATVDKWRNWRMYDYITKVHLRSRCAPAAACVPHALRLADAHATRAHTHPHPPTHTHAGAARAAGRALPGPGRQQRGHHWPQHGRPRRADHRAEKPGRLQVAERVCAHLQPLQRAVGPEGLRRLLWCARRCIGWWSAGGGGGAR